MNQLVRRHQTTQLLFGYPWCSQNRILYVSVSCAIRIRNDHNNYILHIIQQTDPCLCRKKKKKASKDDTLSVLPLCSSHLPIGPQPYPVMCGHTYSKSMDQPGKVANPARGQLNREMDISLSVFAPENLVSRDGFGRPVRRQPDHLHTQAESGTYLRDSSRVPRRRPFIYLKPSNTIGPRVHWVTQLRTDGVHCRESAGTGPVNLKVVPNEYCLAWQVTMDQLIYASLSHTHYWHKVGMLKVPTYVVAKPERGLLGRKRAEDHLQSSNESMKKQNITKNDKTKRNTNTKHMPEKDGIRALDRERVWYSASREIRCPPRMATMHAPKCKASTTTPYSQGFRLLNRCHSILLVSSCPSNK